MMAMRQAEIPSAFRTTVARGAEAPRTWRVGVGLAAAGWLALGLMWATASTELFGHDQHGHQIFVATGLFLAGWLVMVAAMMLPSSLPTMHRVDRALTATSQGRPSALLLGYFSVWTMFGLAAFGGDAILHQVVHAVPWLEQHPWVVLSGAAMFAGASEMIGRSPRPSLPVAVASAGPLSLGMAHASDRVRRCWPMMLFAMAVGMSSPVWMLGLTCVMGLEQRPGARLVLRLVGVAVFALGLSVMVDPQSISVVLWAPGPR